MRCAARQALALRRAARPSCLLFPSHLSQRQPMTLPLKLQLQGTCRPRQLLAFSSGSAMTVAVLRSKCEWLRMVSYLSARMPLNTRGEASPNSGNANETDPTKSRLLKNRFSKTYAPEQCSRAFPDVTHCVSPQPTSLWYRYADRIAFAVTPCTRPTSSPRPFAGER